jgi:Cu/Ag efflux pump CusA
VSVLLSVTIGIVVSSMAIVLAGLILDLSMRMPFFAAKPINTTDLRLNLQKEQKENGVPLLDAATEGARLRFRPVMMTSFAFILGLLPL